MLRQVRRYKQKAPRLYSVRWLETRLDELTSGIVRINEQVCFNAGCGVKTGLQCGHLFERRHRPTRWDIHPEGNNHSQCERHNFLHEEKPSLYQDSFIERFGERAFDDLANRSRSNTKITYSDLEALYEERKQQLAELKKAA